MWGLDIVGVTHRCKLYELAKFWEKLQNLRSHPKPLDISGKKTIPRGKFLRRNFSSKTIHPTDGFNFSHAQLRVSTTTFRVDYTVSFICFASAEICIPLGKCAQKGRTSRRNLKNKCLNSFCWEIQARNSSKLIKFFSTIILSDNWKSFFFPLFRQVDSSTFAWESREKFLRSEKPCGRVLWKRDVIVGIEQKTA